MRYVLGGARIFTGDAFLEGHAVVVEDGRVLAVVPLAETDPGQRRMLEGGLLAPGFVDVQVNGGGGVLFNDSPDVEGVSRIAASHRAFGTTALLPTVITDAQRVIASAVAAVADARRVGVPGILGIHVEGPFIDAERKGVHAARFIREMTEADAAEIAGFSCGTVMVTLAPNRVPPRLVAMLVKAGVLVSLGHADATLAQAQAALAAGARGFTHLFNAMSQMNGREPGMVGAALADAESFVSLIADGHHVHDAAMRIALSAKPDHRMMLISDAMPSAAGGPSTFTLQGHEARVDHGRLTLSDGTLAGSTITMDQAVRHCVELLGIELGAVLRMASLTPAAFLRLDHEIGRIAPGYVASLVHLDDGLRVKATFVAGE